MPPRGQKPKPYALKEAEGFPGHRQHSQGVEVAAEDFAPPVTLGAVARKEWNRLMEVAFWLRPSDAAALADRCACWQRLQEAEAAIKKLGILVESPKGGMRANPAISVAKSYRNALQRYDAELGLTASSRTRVSVGNSGTTSTAPGKGNADAIEKALCGQLPN
jgi:P27 family predicted phage terminase small subunit